MKEIPGSEDTNVTLTCKSCGATLRIKLVDNRDDKSNKAAFISQSLATLRDKVNCPKCGSKII